MRARMMYAGAAVITLVICGGCSTRVLNSPTFQVAESDSVKVHEIVRTVLLARKWVIVVDQPNAVEATYRRIGGATARIRVSHTGNSVSIAHVDSSGLDYRLSPGSGNPLVHRTYNGWVANLERDIQALAGPRH